MRSIFLLALFGASAQAAYFNSSGLPIEEGTQDSPGVYWRELSSNETQWNGACTYFSYPITLIKTWTGDKPANDTPAYGLMHPSCWGNGDSPTSVARILNNNTFYQDDLGVQINRYADVSPDLRPNPTYTLHSVKISTFNVSTFSVVEFKETAQALLDADMKFYPIAKKLPDLNSEISSITIWGPVWRQRTKRISTGKFLGAVKSIKADTGFIKSYFAFRHSCNYFNDGSPLFNADGELLGMSILLDTEWNYGNHVIGLDECFEPDSGKWDFNRKNCLRDYKAQFFTLWKFALPGYNQVCKSGRCLQTLSEDRISSIDIAAGSGGAADEVAGSGVVAKADLGGDDSSETFTPISKQSSASSLTVGSGIMIALISTMFMF